MKTEHYNAILAALWFINWAWLGRALWLDSASKGLGIFAVVLVAPIGAIVCAFVEMAIAFCIWAGIHAILIGVGVMS